MCSNNFWKLAFETGCIPCTLYNIYAGPNYKHISECDWKLKNKRKERKTDFIACVINLKTENFNWNLYHVNFIAFFILHLFFSFSIFICILDKVPSNKSNGKALKTILLKLIISNWNQYCHLKKKKINSSMSLMQSTKSTLLYKCSVTRDQWSVIVGRIIIVRIASCFS